MRFNEFEDYWKYLDVQAVSWQDDLEVELGEPLFIPIADRNFLLEFKNKAGANYKIGLCADGLDTAGHVFFAPPSEYAGLRTIDWNVALRSHYGDTHPSGTIKKFHAVILHTYNSPNSWYDACVIGPDTANPFIDSILYTCPIWDTINQDARLQNAFDAVRLNFRDFIKTHYDFDMVTFNSILNFNLTSSIKKDMWITEWNLKDEGTDDRGKVFTNGFMHGVLLQEWWMKNLKLNFTSGYREHFFKYSTVQNLAGGSAIALLTPADEDVELDIFGKDYAPYNLMAGDPAKRNYYVRRTGWFVMQLMSEINKNNLNYFPASVATFGHNPNLPPSFFITPAKDYVYMYFTNSQCKEQRYILNPAGMSPLFGYPVELLDAEIHAVDAYQAYSTSGNSKLYEINNCYNTNPYTIEIDSIYTSSNPSCDAPEGSLCVNVPGFTFGYVKMHVIPYIPKVAEERKNDIYIYPNPANSALNISATDEMLKIEVYSMAGVKMLEQENNSTSLDISILSYGMYQIVCIFKDGNRIVKSFIKA